MTCLCYPNTDVSRFVSSNAGTFDRDYKNGLLTKRGVKMAGY